eukprot:CAMPEP_0202442698 /NCGR_PEP_ID=MMETSP1360-20130828/2083_1 /ASSEMBLY_ACC=CAM_ASM_000848 /TAXON_ID=515479 /ORGANISM="Licmophora paradoxa, Strain CCMP2313" /LENGTH=44 /DNA_ID= /DNA_START= /DNA_END= /DNA_ORIENTATION=
MVVIRKRRNNIPAHPVQINFGSVAMQVNKVVHDDEEEKKEAGSN